MPLTIDENGVQDLALDALAPESKRRLISETMRDCFYLFCVAFFRHAYPDEKFMPNWHIEAMCHLIERAINGTCPRLLINLPPRHLKSYIASVALPAYLLGKHPHTRILITTYSRDLGMEHGTRTRRIMNSDRYKRLFPRTIITTENNDEIMTTRGGSRRIVTPGSSTQGLGADYIVIDDPINGVDARSQLRRDEFVDYYQMSLLSRLNSSDEGRIISVQQRLHEDDFPAFLIDQGGFETLTLKSIADTDAQFDLYGQRTHQQRAGDILFEDFMSRTALDQKRLEVGKPVFEAQYQQNPVPPGGTLLNMSALQFYDEPVARVDLIDCYQVWDTAFSEDPRADYSVCITFGFDGEAWLIIDVHRRRLSFPSLKDAFWAQKHLWEASRVHIEIAGSGQSLLQQIRREYPEARVWFHGSRPSQDKETRLAAASAHLEAGLVKFPAFDTPWKETLMRELSAFPNGQFDDQVDVITLFVEWMTVGRAPEPGRKPGSRPRGSRRLRSRRRTGSILGPFSV